MSSENFDRFVYLTVPDEPSGLVVFAHGRSSRHGTRNRAMCEVLNEAGLGTLRVDLFGPEDESHSGDIDLTMLVHRLGTLTGWITDQDLAIGHPIGYLGTGIGAVVALLAAADIRTSVAAVVCCGGRPDLAGPALAAVRAPTLLIGASRDPAALAMNHRAAELMSCEKELAEVPHATQLFDEPGTADRAAELACDWFTAHLAPSPAVAGRVSG
ncbi:dienelactone hydrolase family protein [Nocardia vaccinii]|uniref:dienelactone hydrolase family protein n=1 Tax=Nocardia vaccinii TaxID=1822 RepID=UPI00082B0E15|nr:alpha/beta hydrolase [Nocardia vaccinii]